MQVTIREYIEREFSPASRPSEGTVRDWIKRGMLPYPARRIGRIWYIELTPPEHREPGTDPLVLKVING